MLYWRTIMLNQYYILTIFPVLICNLLWLKLTKDVFNPISRLSLFFWLPSCLSMFRLSPYQIEFTTGATLFIGLSTSLSIIIPTIFLLARKIKSKDIFSDDSGGNYLTKDINNLFYNSLGVKLVNKSPSGFLSC